MDIYPDSLILANWTIAMDVSLASATAEVYLSGSWRSLPWIGVQFTTSDPVRPFGRIGQILLAGANPVTGVKPTEADSIPLVKVTVGGEVVEVQSSFRISLRT